METSTNLGRVSLVPRGGYDPQAQYQRLDIVRYGGSSYLALRDLQGVTPEDGADYMLIAERGDMGPRGEIGETGPQGIQGAKGEAGKKGDTGETGNGIAGIERTSGTGAAGTTDTYTITMTDGSTTGFQVYNGADGAGAGDMTKSVYDPQGKSADVFAYVDDAVKNVKVDVDADPAEDSPNPVSSGGTYAALRTKQDALTGLPGQVVRFDGMGLPYAAEGWSGRNLLINWDFRNPVNRNGKMEYVNDSSTSMRGIDRWSYGRGSILITENGIVLKWNGTTSSDAYIQNEVESTIFEKGKVTLSCVANGTLHTVTVEVDDLPGAAYYPYTKDGIILGFNKATHLALIKTTSTEGALIQAAKLELGGRQTLARQDEEGGWEIIDPPDYDLQYALCCLYSPSTGEWAGYRHSNENLLDNWYFPAPVNQRGQDEYEASGSSIQCIDRWGLYSNTKMTLSENGITISAIASGIMAQLYQYLPYSFGELAGRTVTLSFLSADGSLYTASGTIGAAEPTAAVNYISLSIPGIGTLRLTYSPASSVKKFYAHIINANAAAGPIAALKAAKLELGPVQTLARKEGDTWVLSDPPPNKALELAKCQRYQLALNGFVRIRAARVLANSIIFFVPIPVSMRGFPTLVDKSSVLRVFNWSDNAEQSGFTFSTAASNCYTAGVFISASKSGHGLTDAYLSVETGLSPVVLLDANL